MQPDGVPTATTAQQNAPAERLGARPVQDVCLPGEPAGSHPPTVETAGAGTLLRLLDTVRAYLSEHYPTRALPDVTDASEFREDLACDPIDMISICLALEDEFGLRLPPDEPEHCDTVGDLAAVVAAVRTKEPVL